jgi:hypothetical protein
MATATCVAMINQYASLCTEGSVIARQRRVESGKIVSIDSTCRTNSQLLS